MRILYYNWADYKDPERRGGGVSVYQRNVIEGLAGRDGIETAFLSAGLAHDLRPAAPRIVTIAGGESPRYSLVNSGLVGPSHADFGGAAQLDHPATEATFADFVDRTGPWDVIHFNNLEGLPAHVLALKDRWPNTKFVLSLHNYYPVCPQVNLWRNESEHCRDFGGGAHCATCLAAHPDPRSVRLAYGVGWNLSRIGAGPGTALYDKGFRPILGFAWRNLRRLLALRNRRRASAAPTPAAQPQKPQTPKPAGQTGDNPFAVRRERMVALINTNCDAVVCVSDRVRQIAEHYGISHDKLLTRYIGTREAAHWHQSHARDSFLDADGVLHMAYLGYMRRDKGYYFLMRALADLPPDLARRVRLTVAAKAGDSEAMGLLAVVRSVIGTLTHVDGYTHDTLSTLLSDVDLGLVPVMWEDNLPQVAIEMHARHIPLLCSDRGGAQELGGCSDLVFKAGDSEDFTRVLTGVLNRTITPSHYWASAKAPVEMPEHLDALVALYQDAS